MTARIKTAGIRTAGATIARDGMRPPRGTRKNRAIIVRRRAVGGAASRAKWP